MLRLSAILMLVAIATGCGRPDRTAAAASTNAPAQWEYETMNSAYFDTQKTIREGNRALQVYVVNEKRCDYLFYALREMGGLGWEFAGTIPYTSGGDILFKRRKGAGPKTEVRLEYPGAFDESGHLKPR